MVKTPPAVQETWVLYLGWEDPLRRKWQPSAVFPCLENPMDRGAWWATVHGVKRVRHDLVTKQQGTEGSGESGLQVE